MTKTTKARKHSGERVRSRMLAASSQEVKEPAVNKPTQGSSMNNPSIRFDDTVSLVDVKDVAKRLPESSLARQLILRMDDSLPRWIALGQMLLVHKIIYEDLHRAQ